MQDLDLLHLMSVRLLPTYLKVPFAQCRIRVCAKTIKTKTEWIPRRRRKEIWAYHSPRFWFLILIFRLVIILAVVVLDLRWRFAGNPAWQRYIKSISSKQIAYTVEDITTIWELTLSLAIRFYEEKESSKWSPAHMTSVNYNIFSSFFLIYIVSSVNQIFERMDEMEKIRISRRRSYTKYRMIQWLKNLFRWGLFELPQRERLKPAYFAEKAYRQFLGAQVLLYFPSSSYGTLVITYVQIIQCITSHPVQHHCYRSIISPNSWFCRRPPLFW